MLNSEKYQIAKLLAFSDNEISIMQYYIAEFCNVNEEQLTKPQCYQLGILACGLQYNMRILRSRIGSKHVTDSETLINNNFIVIINTYDELINYCITRICEDFNNADMIKKYEMVVQSTYSYFSASADVKRSCINDINKLTIE